MTTTNSTDTKPFTDRVREQLSELRASVDGTLADIQATGARAGADLRFKRDEAQAGMKARRQKIESANAAILDAVITRAEAEEAKEHVKAA